MPILDSLIEDLRAAVRDAGQDMDDFEFRESEAKRSSPDLSVVDIIITATKRSTRNSRSYRISGMAGDPQEALRGFQRELQSGMFD